MSADAMVSVIGSLHLELLGETCFIPLIKRMAERWLLKVPGARALMPQTVTENFGGWKGRYVIFVTKY